jgi:hypothetical protein
VRFTPVVLVVATAAGAAHIAGVALDRPAVALPGGAAALVALAAYALVTGRHRPTLVRWSLLAGVLVLAAGTATGLVWDVAAARSQPFAFFAYEPLDNAALLPRPDLWHHRWVEAVALAAYAGIALAVVRLPRRAWLGYCADTAPTVGGSPVRWIGFGGAASSSPSASNWPRMNVRRRDR